MKWLESINYKNLIAGAIVIAVFIALWIFLRFLFRKWIAAERKAGSKRGIASIIWDITKLLLATVFIVVLLEVNGVDVTGAIAGLGIASAVIGLALQDILKDIIMGIHIAVDGFYKVGDYIYYEGDLCRVSDFNLRTTKLVNITKPGNFTVCNRLIESVELASEFVQLNIPVSYKIPLEQTERVLREACHKVERMEKVSKVIYSGLDRFEDSSMVYVIKLFCDREDRYNTYRAAMRVIKACMDEGGVTVPFNQVDVHFDGNVPAK